MNYMISLSSSEINIILHETAQGLVRLLPEKAQKEEGVYKVYLCCVEDKMVWGAVTVIPHQVMIGEGGEVVGNIVTFSPTLFNSKECLSDYFVRGGCSGRGCLHCYFADWYIKTSDLADVCVLHHKKYRPMKRPPAPGHYSLVWRWSEITHLR